MQKAWQKIRILLRHFFLLNDSPHKIAGGFALGVFLGAFPGLGILATLALAALLRLNEAAALAGVLGVNLWLTVLLLPIAASIGGWLFESNPAILTTSFENIIHQEWQLFFSKNMFLEITFPLVSGFLISAGLIAGLAYLTVFLALKYHKIRFR